MIKNYITLIFSSLLLYVAASAPLQLKAQEPIPNPGFENWTNGEPDGWNTINQEILGTSFTPVTRDQTNMHSGTSSVKLETITENIIFVGPVTLPGMITLGEITLDIVNLTGDVKGGIPTSGKPQKLRGWFQYQPQPTDSCIMGIALTRWTGSQRDTLAYSYLTVGETINNWQEFTVPVEYEINAEPDSMNIIFFSSNLLNGSPIAGSKLWVDDLWLDYETVSIKLAEQYRDFFIRSSPEGVFIVTNSTQPAMVQVFSLSGTLVYEAQLNPQTNQHKLSLPVLPSGLYIARYTTATGVRKASKFIIN